MTKQIIDEMFTGIRDKNLNDKIYPGFYETSENKSGASYFYHRTKILTFVSNKKDSKIQFYEKFIKCIPDDVIYTINKNHECIIKSDDIDIERLCALMTNTIQHIYENLLTDPFDCCSRYKECSLANECVNDIFIDDTPLSNGCAYKKKLKQGINFYKRSVLYK